jgi:hypothetical protein
MGCKFLLVVPVGTLNSCGDEVSSGAIIISPLTSLLSCSLHALLWTFCIITCSLFILAASAFSVSPCCSCRREASFSSPLPEDEPQDYEHDAIVVHMGRFAAETPLPPGQPDAAKPASVQQQQGRKGKLGLKQRSTKAVQGDGDGCSTVDGAAAGPPASQKRGKSEPDLELLFVGSRVQRTHSCKQGAAAKKDASKQSLQVQQLHLYSIACPGMRRWPDNTQDLGAALAWAEPVNMKPGWAQLQKGFFQAPGGTTDGH